MKKIAGELIIDKTRRYAMTSELSIQKVKNSYVYTPRFELQYPGIQPVEMNGKIIVDKKNKLDLDLTLHGIRSSPFTLKCKFLHT